MSGFPELKNDRLIRAARGRTMYILKLLFFLILSDLKTESKFY